MKEFTYEDIEGWFEFEDIYYIMASQFDNAHFVEIGSWLGRSSVCMASNIKTLNKKIKFDCIDIWKFDEKIQYYKELIEKKGNIYFAFLNNAKKAKVLDFIRPIKLSSEKASFLYEDNSLDFVFIDANHSYEYVKQDILLWLPKVKIGGYIGGYGYKEDHQGVVKAVDEIIGNDKEHIRSSWLYKKQNIL